MIFNEYLNICWELNVCLTAQCFPDKARAKKSLTHDRILNVYILPHTSWVWLQHTLKAETHCDKSLRHVMVTAFCDKSPHVTCENHCSCDRILSLRCLRATDRSDKISTSRFVTVKASQLDRRSFRLIDRSQFDRRQESVWSKMVTIA